VNRALAILLAGLVIGCKGTAPSDPVDETPASITPAEPVDDACCSVDPAPAEPLPTELVPPGAELPAEPVPSLADEAAATPAAMYAACRERVEQPEAAGECKTAADCGVSGCGGELCAAKSHGAISSTCEVRACFQVLDSCGCVDGRCTWSLKAAIPEQRRMIPIE